MLSVSSLLSFFSHPRLVPAVLPRVGREHGNRRLSRVHRAGLFVSAVGSHDC